MTSPFRRLMLVVMVMAPACSGGGASTAPTAATTAATTEIATTNSTQGSAPQLDVAATVAAAAGLTEALLSDRDVIGDDLIAAMGVSEALGGEADEILGLAAEARSAAVEQLPTKAPVVSGLRGGQRRISVNDALWLMIKEELPPSLDYVTSFPEEPNGENTETNEPTSTTPGPGASATSTVSQTATLTVAGSRVQLSIHRIDKEVVTDATGAVSLERTDDRTVTAAISVCPDSSGVSNALTHTVIMIDATTHPGAAGRVGVHAVGHGETTSNFAGQVDDGAALQGVTQDFAKKSDWKRTAAAEGGSAQEHGGSLDAAFNGITTVADAAGDLSVQSMDASAMTGEAGVTGDGTQEMINDSIGNAAIDLITIIPSYKEAQRLWRNGRCVVLAAPGYKAETPIPTRLQEASQHTEIVDQSSSTDFAVSMHHRFDGPMIAETLTELTTGDKSLDPESLPKGEGTLTYVAPDENGKDAVVKLTSTSNRGIGTLVLTFHTATEQLQVDINGTETFDDIIATTVNVSSILLTKQPDGSFAGSAASEVVGVFGPCGRAITETGTIGLTATQAEGTGPDGAPNGDWTIVSAPIPTDSQVTVTCAGGSMDAFAGLFGGVGYSFVNDLGPMTVSATGGTLTLHKEGSYGPLDATVVVQVLTGD